jgi:hypothetical protein
VGPLLGRSVSFENVTLIAPAGIRARSVRRAGPDPNTTRDSEERCAHTSDVEEFIRTYRRVAAGRKTGNEIWLRKKLRK